MIGVIYKTGNTLERAGDYGVDPIPCETDDDCKKCITSMNDRVAGTTTEDPCFGSAITASCTNNGPDDHPKAIATGWNAYWQRNVPAPNAPPNAPPSSPPPAPCFPSHATVVLADGTPSRIDALKEGDELVVATADGTLSTDIVSHFSLADPTAKASFIELTSEAGKKIELTAGHHIPAGPNRALKQAKDVTVGDTLWLADSVSGTLRPERVAKIDVAIRVGLHNPLMKHGGMPIVNGVATSFNNAAIVAIDSFAVPIVEALCVATGSCSAARRTIAALECAAKHAFSATPVCKTYHYVDGLVVVSSLAAADVAASLAAFAVATLSAGAAIRALK